MKTLFDLERFLRSMPESTPTETEKEVLWSKIENKINAPSGKIPVSRRFPFSFFPTLESFTNIKRWLDYVRHKRFAYATISLFAIIGISTASIAAARNSAPGDLLFPLEMAVEKIQITFGRNKDELKIKFAAKRLDEAKHVMAATTPTATTTHASQTVTTSPADYALKNIKNLEKTEHALVFALEQLEKTRGNFEKENNANAVATVKKKIEDLKTLTQNHLDEIEKIQNKLATSSPALKEFKNHNEKLKNKFKFTEKDLGRRDDDDKDDKKRK